MVRNTENWILLALKISWLNKLYKHLPFLLIFAFNQFFLQKTKKSESILRKTIWCTNIQLSRPHILVFYKKHHLNFTIICILETGWNVNFAEKIVLSLSAGTKRYMNSSASTDNTSREIMGPLNTFSCIFLSIINNFSQRWAPGKNIAKKKKKI